MHPTVRKVISGGQTGADRAALDAATELGILTGGWIPKGRRAEDGEIPGRYSSLRECESADYSHRTRLNVSDSDATLIISRGPLFGGSLLTQEAAKELGKPFLHIDLESQVNQPGLSVARRWLVESRCEILNIAGPRASSDPQIYDLAKEFIKTLLNKGV